MKIDKIALLGGVSLLAAGVTFGDAMAQRPTGAPGQPQQRLERPDDRTPSARAAEDYDPVGVRVGSFKLFPELQLDEIYNDNIYAANASIGKQGSFVQLIKPTLDLRSDWNNHMLNFFARGAFGFYSASSMENYQDFSVGADGRIDIQRNWNIYGGGSFNRRHEERGTPNAITGAFEPNKFDQIVGNLGYYQRFNRISLRLDGRIDNYHYLDSGPGPVAGAIFNWDRDRTEFRESLRLGYEFLPGFEVWARGSMNQRRYANGVDSQGFARNSSGFDVVGGVAIDLGGITSVELFAGYVQQDYVDGRYPSIMAPTFGVAAYWNPIRELWVKPFLRRTIEDSALTSTAAYLNTAMGIDVDYRMRPNIRLDGHFDYAIADYNAISGAAQRYDQYFTFRAGVMYLPTPNFYLGPTYQFIHRTSNQVGSDYDQNTITLRLGARM